MVEKVISGGQTGADQAGLRAAKAAGIPTGGTAPKGWLTEDGPAPWLADYGLVECDVPGYPARTERNAADAQLTIWFGSVGSSGYWCTRKAAWKHHRAFWEIGAPAEGTTEPRTTAKNLRMLAYRIINVAGNRASRMPGGEWVESFLAEVFRLLREGS